MSGKSHTSTTSSVTLFTLVRDDGSNRSPSHRKSTDENEDPGDANLVAECKKKISATSTQRGLLKQSALTQRGTSPSLFTRSKAVNGCATINLQYSGTLEMQNFYSLSLRRWRTRYFIIKDGFLAWYRALPAENHNFSIHPAGFLPLSGCIVSPEGLDKSGNCCFSLGIPIKHKKLKLRTRNSHEVDNWINILQSVTHVNFDVAKLGRTRMFLQREETKLCEAEKEKALMNARAKAKLVYEANQARRKLMENQLRNRKKNVRLFQISDKERRRKSAEVHTLTEDITVIEEELAAQSFVHESLEANTQAALTAVYQLTLFVLEHKGDPKQKSRLIGDLERLGNLLNTDADIN